MHSWARHPSKIPVEGRSLGPCPAAANTARAVFLLALTFGSLALFTLTGCSNGVASSSAQQATPAAPTASALGPQLGYIWITSDQSLRPILGIPGASQIGQSVVPAGEYIGAASSATANLALLQAADGSLDLMTLPSGSPVSLGLNLPPGAKLRLSPSAAAALAFLPGSISASLITGLPSSPRLQTVSAPASIADAAVSDTGAVCLESSRSVAVAALNQSAVRIATIGAPGGLSFLPNGPSSHDDLLFADAAANTLAMVRSTTSSPLSQTIATSGLLQSPSAVGVSGSGRWALIANRVNQIAVRVDLSTLASVAVACVCQPTLAEPLADDGAFRVTSLSSGPNWLVNAAPATPRTLFIPALPASSLAAGKAANLAFAAER